MQHSPYDENWNLDLLAVELQMSVAVSIVDMKLTPTCGGCDAKLKSTSTDSRGREVRDYECGHRYTVGARTVSIERV